MNWFRRLLPRNARTADQPFGRVEFNAESVRYEMPDGTIQSITWDEVEEIGVVRTDEGPVSDDLFFTLTSANREKGCAIPQSAAGMDALIVHLEDLPGFNNIALGQAMGSTTNAVFELWQRRK